MDTLHVAEHQNCQAPYMGQMIIHVTLHGHSLMQATHICPFKKPKYSTQKAQQGTYRF